MTFEFVDTTGFEPPTTCTGQTQTPHRNHMFHGWLLQDFAKLYRRIAPDTSTRSDRPFRNQTRAFHEAPSQSPTISRLQAPTAETSAARASVFNLLQPTRPLAQSIRCWHYASMSIQITIRDVPEKVRDELAARAALKGKSMQEYLRAELESLAARPSVDAWLEQVRNRKQASRTRVSIRQILKERDADRR